MVHQCARSSVHPQLLVFKLDENVGTQSSSEDAAFTVDIRWLFSVGESFPSTTHLHWGSEPRAPGGGGVQADDWETCGWVGVLLVHRSFTESME